MTVTPIETFLYDAATASGLTVDALLSRVLHVEDGALDAAIALMDSQTKALALRLDREIRVRNPGLHYVIRKRFVGYRREGDVRLAPGARSQIFISLIRNSSRLEVVLPIDPEDLDSVGNIEDLRGRGHHGVGDVRVSLRDDAEIQRFLSVFDDWLTPRPLPKI